MPIQTAWANTRLEKLPLKACGGGIGHQAISGDMFSVKNGDVISLADYKAPEFWPETSDYKTWFFGHESKARLHKLIHEKPLIFYCYSKKQSPFQGKVAHVSLAHTNTWLQQILIEEGFGFYYSEPNSMKETLNLRSMELVARLKKSGLWQYTNYQSLLADPALIKIGWFQTIHGKVLSVKQLKNKTYLNFGPDWKTDFTIEIPSGVLRKMKKTGIDPTTFQNKNVEIRGWVEWAGGPKIILSSHNNMHIVSEPK